MADNQVVYPPATAEVGRRRRELAPWVAAEMRAGGAYAHSTVALHALERTPETVG